jgi:hypothetical protein
MEIVPPDDSSDQNRKDRIDHVDLTPGSKSAYIFAQNRDDSGMVLQSFILMDSVEEWVIAKMTKDQESEGVERVNLDEVRVRCQRLSEALSQHADRVPADHFSLVQLLGWMNASESFYVLEFLTQRRPEFFSQFFAHVQRTADFDPAADVAMQRIRAVFRADFARKIFSQENVDYVMKIILDLEGVEA